MRIKLQLREITKRGQLAILALDGSLRAITKGATKDVFRPLIVAMLFLLAGKNTSAQWSTLNPTNPQGNGRPTIFVIGDTVYYGNGDPWNSNFYQYTTQSNTFVQVVNCPNGGGDQGFQFVINDTAYVGDGANPGYHNDFWAYTPSAGWIPLSGTYPSAVPPGGGRCFTSGFSIGNKGYFGSGYTNGGNPDADFYEYNTFTHSWTPKASLPVGTFGTVAFSANGKGYMGLGYVSNNGNNNVFNTMYQYDPVLDQWNTMAPLPASVGMGEAEPAYFVVCGKLIVTLGQTYHATGRATRQAWMFDPTDGPIGKWFQLPDCPAYPAYSPGGFSVRDTGYVIGGSDTSTYQGVKQLLRFIPNINPITVTPNTQTCSGVSVTLTADGGGAFKWSPTTGLSDSITTSTNATGGLTSVTASPSVTTTYTVTEATCGQTATVVVTVGSLGSLSILPKSPTVCAGQSVTLSVPGNVSNVVWSPSTGLNQATGDTVIATPLVSTVYTVTASGGCASSGTDTVNVNQNNALIFTPAMPQTCPGQSTSISVSGGTNFNWSPATGLNQASGDTVTASLPNGVDSIPYTVIGLSLSGCPDTGFVILVSGGGAFPGTVTAVRDTICQGTPGNLALTGNSSNTLLWQSSTDDATFNDAGGKNDTTKYKTAPLLKTTWYRVEVGTGACSAISDTFQLYVPPALNAYFAFSQPASNELSFNSDSSSGNIRSYHWDFGDGGTSTDSNPQHTYAKDSTYYVCLTLYDGSNCSYTFCRYSSVTDAVQNIPVASQWAIYPNPFSNQLFINGKDLNLTVKSIELYDVLGRQVFNREYEAQSNNFLIDVSTLSQGMYFVEIKTANANFFQPIIKQK